MRNSCIVSSMIACVVLLAGCGTSEEGDEPVNDQLAGEKELSVDDTPLPALEYQHSALQFAQPPGTENDDCEGECGPAVDVCSFALNVSSFAMVRVALVEGQYPTDHCAEEKQFSSDYWRVTLDAADPLRGDAPRRIVTFLNRSGGFDLETGDIALGAFRQSGETTVMIAYLEVSSDPASSTVEGLPTSREEWVTKLNAVVTAYEQECPNLSRYVLDDNGFDEWLYGGYCDDRNIPREGTGD